LEVEAHQQPSPHNPSNHPTKLIAKKNIPFYCGIAAIFLLLKLGYTMADNNSLVFLLKPTNALVGLLTGSTSTYFADSGYFYSNLNIVIEKSCSGFNFLILCFGMLGFLMIKYAGSILQKLLAIPVCLLIAYVFTILVNGSRIFASIIIQHQSKNFAPNISHAVLHEIIGVTTNLSFLILAYYLFEKILKNSYKNEKLA
jgi:exosortase K